MAFLEKFKFKKKSAAKDIVLTAFEAKNKTLEQEKYNDGLKKSRDSFTKKIKLLTNRHLKLTDEYFVDLEKFFVEADLGLAYAQNLISELKKTARIKKITDANKMFDIIFEQLFADYYRTSKEENHQLLLSNHQPDVILIIGVNGTGKTTSVAKLANYLVTTKNKTVLLAAADTFRAGAVEQLSIWSKTLNIPIVVPKKPDQDPASIVFEAVKKAQTDKIDVVIIDTAGRLQNKVNLMQELNKINSIVVKITNQQINEKLLVLDATTGQNGIFQAKAFNEVLSLTGIILTKIDSSSKGGIILPIKQAFNLPVKFIGLGEKIDDLKVFDFKEYLGALIDDL